MPDRIQITLDATQARAQLRRLIQRGSDLTPVMGEIAGELLSEVEDAFDNESDPSTGERWPALSQSTRDQRSKAGNLASGMLRVKGMAGGLFGSIQADWGADFVEIGSALEYAAIHQLGGTAGRGRTVTIPARPYLGLSEAADRSIADLISDYLTE